MRAVVREITGTNGSSLGSICPKSAEFETTLQIVIGPDIGTGEELFELTVCDIDAYARTCAADGYAWTHAVLALERFDQERIVMTINNLVSVVEGPDWRAVVDQLRKFMRWEFDNYGKR